MARDFYHDHVKAALEKSGWKITDDPYEIKVDKIAQEIDFGAEQLFAAEKGEELIAVEVKSFVGLSDISEFHRAVGQFVNYRSALSVADPERIIFLAVPSLTWDSFFQEKVVQISLGDIRAKVMIYDPVEKKIVGWKTY